MNGKLIVFAGLAVLSTGAFAVHPKDQAVEWKKLADETFAAHREEADRTRRLELLGKSAEWLEKIVYMEGCADEALRVEATERASERFRLVGEPERALKVLVRTLTTGAKLSPDCRLRLLMSRAALEEALGYAKEAEKAYAEALTIDTRDMTQVARARNRIATILTEVKGRHAEALKALEYRLEDPLTQQSLHPHVLAERAYVAGCALRGLKRYAESKTRLEESIKLFGPGRWAARSELVVARVCFDQKDRKGAMAALDRAVAAEPGYRQQAEHLRQGMEVAK